MSAFDRVAAGRDFAAKQTGKGDNLDIEVLVGTEVVNWGRAIDRIKLEVVPGKGITYDGCESLDVCLRRVVPALRDCSPPVFAAVKQLAMSRLGFT